MTIVTLLYWFIDILNYVSGEIRVPPSYRQDGLDIRYSANGSYELIYDSINSDFAWWVESSMRLFKKSITASGDSTIFDWVEYSA